jgi:hypothetical protein
MAVIAVAARAYISWRTHFTAANALITLRYADNFAVGQGFDYNAGAHLLDVSGPLYAMLLSIFSSSPYHLNPLVAGKALNIAADGVTCYLLARLLARSELGRPVEGLFAASLYAFSTTPIMASVCGMETGLVTCIGMAMVYAYVASRPYWLYPLGATLFLLSIDGLALFVVLASALGLRERKFPSRAGAVALIIVIPWLIFATAYFGSPIPNSPTAMSTLFAHAQAAPERYNIGQANKQMFTTQFASGWIQFALSLLFVLGAILVVCQAVRRAERGVMAGPLVWCLITLGAMLFSRITVYPWYFAPPWPIFIAIACLAAATAPIKLGKMRPDLAAAWSARAVPGALALLILMGVVNLRGIIVEIGAVQKPQQSTPATLNSTTRASR